METGDIIIRISILSISTIAMISLLIWTKNRDRKQNAPKRIIQNL